MIKVGVILSLIFFFSNACGAQSKSMNVSVSAEVEIPVQYYFSNIKPNDSSDPEGPGNKISLLWLPSENGFQQTEIKTAVALAQNGVNVYMADLHSAYFVEKSSSSINIFKAKDLLVLIEKLAQSSKGKLILVSGDKGVIVALRALRQWQLKHGDSTSGVLGAILLSGQYFKNTPEPGLEGKFYPIVSLTSMPLVLIQPVNSPWYWKLPKTVPVLTKGGSVIFVRIIPGIRDRFYYRPDATPLEQKMADKLPIIIGRAVKLLKPYSGKSFAAVKKPNFPKSISKIRKKSVPRLRLYKGKPVPPELNLLSLSGSRVELKELKSHVLLVNFWASWCPPCVHEMPSMQKLSEMFIAKKFKILAVNMAEEISVIKTFLKEKVSVDFPILLDSDGTALTRWKVYAFPTSYMIDKKGLIRYAVFGAIDWSSPEVIQIVNKLLAE